jgi:NADH:ubiquinone oxidoreductase subunit K
VIHQAWIFAAATTTAGLGIWLLLSPLSARWRQSGAVLAAIGAVIIGTQAPRGGSPWADSAFLLFSAVLLTGAVATVVSRRPLLCVTCFFIALATAAALLLLFADTELAVVAAVATLFVLLPGGYLIMFQREALRKLVQRNIDEPSDAPAWEPLLCATSGMVLAGVLVTIIHAAYNGNDALAQNYMTLAAVLLGVGVSGFLSRQSLIVMLLSAEIMLLGAMLGWTAGYCISANVAGRNSLMMLALAAAAQPLVVLAALYPVSRGLKKPTEARLLQGGTFRGEVLAMVAGLLIIIGMLLS